MDLRKGKHTTLFHRFTQALKIMLVGGIILTGIFVFNYFELSCYFPIKTVRVYGINHTNHQEMQTLLLPLVNHGFFDADVEYIRDSLLQLPWVSTISVRRCWPDVIEVTVLEKNVLARWNTESLLSDAGELFSPHADIHLGNLPTFVGPAGQQVVMLKYFQDMNRLLDPLHAKISYLELTPYLTWKLSLDNGITLQIGHKDILTRLGHFVKVYPKIVGNHAKDVDYIDLRYPNGVAVRWKQL
ncbi:MAG: cell division protein FtsQ/DivIB [Gammaproteobacteria bacterium]|nr:cell division protein FtsQ/DivIB [Gammaproteobacteria bacterium]